MRFIIRNCYRKTIVGTVFLVFFILILIETQRSDKTLIKQQLSATKGDKSWEWSREKLNEFMYELNKHKEPIDNNALHLIHPTNNTITTDDKLVFPQISKYLTYISDEKTALMPAYVLSTRAVNRKASVVFGVPHIRRSKESYLQMTLYFLIKNLKAIDTNDTLIIVFIAETDLDYVTNTTRMIAHHFRDSIASGLLTVISPAKTYYPDFEKQYKKQTLGDPLKRVHWRTKQNLDFAYLMTYAYTRGQYYVQLEDDVISAPDFVGQIKKTIIDLQKNKTEWFAVRFCRLGFIGQMIKTSDLPQLITFLLVFHEDQPSDWLLDDLIQTRACRKDKDSKDCRKRKDQIWRTHQTSLFQHIGYHSSLDGKVQKLKDKFFKTKDFSYFAHKDNPNAEVMTSFNAYKDHNIVKAYKGEDYFWAMEPKSGDNITIIFTPPVLLDSVAINSGNFEHPNDKIPDETTVEIMTELIVPISANLSISHTPDGYYIIDRFEDGFIKIDNMNKFGLIKRLRVRVTKDSNFWLILNELHIKT